VYVAKIFKGSGSTLNALEIKEVAENLQFTLNGETRRVPGQPDTHAQMAWEDMDKVS
jgi:hypothetical protein